MVNTCAVAGCKTNYKKRMNWMTTIPERGHVFVFPDKSHIYLRSDWIKFVKSTRQQWAGTVGTACRGGHVLGIRKNIFFIKTLQNVKISLKIKVIYLMLK